MKTLGERNESQIELLMGDYNRRTQYHENHIVRYIPVPFLFFCYHLTLYGDVVNVYIGCYIFGTILINKLAVVVRLFLLLECKYGAQSSTKVYTQHIHKNRNKIITSHQDPKIAKWKLL